MCPPCVAPFPCSLCTGVGGSPDFRPAGPGANWPHLGLSGSAQRVFDHISIFCNILNIYPPYWIRDFVFTHFAYVSVISDLGSPQIPTFDDICHILNTCPPYWIRHFVLHISLKPASHGATKSVLLKPATGSSSMARHTRVLEAAAMTGLGLSGCLPGPG